VTVPKVEIGFSGPSLRTAFQLDDPTYGRLDSGVLGVGVTLVDVTDRLVSLNIRRGRNEKTEPTQAGQATITLRNRDGLLDPLNTASSLYPGVEPRRPVNVYADGVQVYAGWVDDLDLDYSPGGDAEVTVSASDGLARLALAEFPVGGTAFSQADSGQRVTDVLNSVPTAWTAGSAIDTGDSTLAAGTASGNVLQYLQTVERSEGGYLFVNREGDLTFRNRNNPAQNPGGLIVSDAGGTACTPFVEISRQAGIEDVYNRVSAIHTGSTVIASDTDSITDYGLRELELGELLLTSESDTQQRVEYEVVRRADALTSVKSVTVDQAATGGGCPLTLQHDLGDSVKVIFTPPGVTQQTQTSVLLGVDHRWQVSGTWRTTFRVGPVDEGAFLILDDVDYGQLDVGALAF